MLSRAFLDMRTLLSHYVDPLSGLGTCQISRKADAQLKAAGFPALLDIGIKSGKNGVLVT